MRVPLAAEHVLQRRERRGARAAAVRVSALKSVDLPTYGSPTMPILKPMPFSPKVSGAFRRGAVPPQDGPPFAGH